MTEGPFRYRVDCQDRVEFVSTEWLAFARRNAAVELDRDAVLGRSLWEFIAGKETRYLYRLIFDAARTQRRDVTVPFRCDSPTCRRYLELVVAPRADDALDISASLIREEPRPYVALLDPGAPRGGDFLTICSWCKRVLVPPNEWEEVEEAIRRLELFGSEPLPNLTHGVCSACESEISATAEV